MMYQILIIPTAQKVGTVLAYFTAFEIVASLYSQPYYTKHILRNHHIIVISKYAGDDATAAFNEIQAPGLLQALRPDQLIGPVDSATMPHRQTTRAVKQANRNENGSQSSIVMSKPPLHSLISVHDFEEVARKTFNAKTMAFYGSAATDLVSFRANSEFHKRLLLRPRVLRNVRESTTKRSILGCDSSAPFFFR